MRGSELLLNMSKLDNELIVEAEEDYYKPNRIHVRKWIAIAACLCLCVCCAVPAFAATGNKIAYDILYSISPYVAQKLKPVNATCIDEGIEMTVIAAEVDKDEATLLVSIRDTTGSRIDGSAHLFDSYGINTPYDQKAGCFFAGYDEKTRTVTFLLSIEQMNHVLIPGDKITFSVGEILSGKKHSSYRLTQINTSELNYATEYAGDYWIRGRSGYGTEDIKLMEPDEENAVVLEEGIAFTGIGIVDGEVHIQIRYDNIAVTDNHGYLYLKGKDGKTIEFKTNVAYWDKGYVNSYEEYVFPISADEINEYEIWGEFWTCNNGPIKGNWEVTIPLAGA